MSRYSLGLPEVEKEVLSSTDLPLPWLERLPNSSLAIRLNWLGLPPEPGREKRELSDELYMVLNRLDKRG